MNISVIVSEYNPFHNGHKYHIEKTREKGSTHIISIMTGNFTQRGTPSIISKNAKAKAALLNGCDLIIELPLNYAISSAEKFALGAIYIANSIRCVNTLSFGCECNNIDLLKYAADISTNGDTIQSLKDSLKTGQSYAKSYYNSINKHNKKIANLFSSPNNILAIEYLKALKVTKSNITPMAIKRVGSVHDSLECIGSFPSSSMIRNLIYKNEYKFSELMPESSYKILMDEIKQLYAPANINLAQRAILARLRMMNQSDLASISNISEGLENRILKSIKTSTSLNELYFNIKTKRYPLSRIRRCVLAAFLGIDKSIDSLSPQYIKVIGFNKKGLDILKLIKERSLLPIVTKYSDILKLNKQAKSIWELESRAFDLYNLMLPEILECNFEYHSKIIKV